MYKCGSFSWKDSDGLEQTKSKISETYLRSALYRE